MTSLLIRPDPARTDGGLHRPLVLIATMGGVLAALGPLIVWQAIGVIGWFISDAGAHGAPRDGMRMGALAWLAAHGSGFSVSAVHITVVPLGVTAISVWSIWRWGHRVGEAVSGHGPDAYRISDGERDFTVPLALTLFLTGYAIVAVVVTTLAASSTIQPSLQHVLLWTFLMASAVAGPAVAIGSGRAAIWARFIPVTVRAGVRVAAAVLRAFLVISTVVFLAALVASFGEAATMTSRLHPSPSEAGLYAVVNAAFLPNAALFSGSWLLGPGFAVGGGTLVSPTTVVLGPLPIFPILAALPGAGTPAGWVRAAVALPSLVAAVSTFRTLRRRPLSWDRLALAGCGGGIVAGAGFAVLASVAGGVAGPGRMRHVGPFVPEVLVHAIAACGIGALVGALMLALIQRRPGQYPEDNLDADPPS